MAKGIGVYSSSVPDKRDRLQHPGIVDVKSGNQTQKRRPLSESDTYDHSPVTGSSGALPKKP